MRFGFIFLSFCVLKYELKTSKKFPAGTPTIPLPLFSRTPGHNNGTARWAES